ncbi:MAG: hypothetical protein ACNA74_02040 [Desulfurivibrio sp.]
MKSNAAAKTGWNIGVGAGVVLFVLLGLLSGPFLGSAMGLKIIDLIYGTMPVETLPKVILAVSMVLGLVVSATIYILGTALLGWGVGYVIGATAGRRVVVAKKVPATTESTQAGFARETLSTG